ncbi:MAG: tripartite tricarboxylate transporter substrate binding protein [Clostridiales bacterium]
MRKELIKILTASMILLLCISLAGCGQSPASSQGAASGATEAANPGGSAAEPAPAPSLDYPKGSITAICPWTAGGSSDITFRSYLSYLSKEIGTDINVLNVTGGDGSIGINQALGMPADGYTMAMLNYDILSNEIKGITEDSYKDFAIINLFTLQGVNLVVNADSGWETFEDFRQAALAAKAAGKTLQIGVNGFWLHAAGMMADAAGIKDCVVFVPSNGSSELMTELLGKHCDAVTTSLTVALPHLESGAMKILGTMAEERMPEFPDIPTFKEMGYPNVIIAGFRILAVHKDTPPEIVDFLRQAGKKAFDNPEFQKWAGDAKADPVYMDAEETVKYLENLAPVVKQTMVNLGLI